MIADVLFYTEFEGGPWLKWPFPKHIKPSNPGLLCHKPSNKTFLRDVSSLRSYHLEFHSLKLSDNSEWDSINGFRDGKGPR